MADFTCAHHTAEVYLRGGVTFVGEITPISEVQWNRLRDDISTANVHVPPTECCDLLSDLRAGRHELHILRDGEPVWEGPITRIEYELNEVRVYAEDMMWVPKRTVLQTGYSNAYPNIGYAIDRADWLLRQQCFNLNGDPWNMLPHVNRLSPLGTGPKTARSVAAYEMYVWQDFDKYAEDHGLDYTVVNRDIFFWDHGLDWLQLPDLSEEFLSESPRVVEYGNDLYTRAFVSNARGYAGIANADPAQIAAYGYVDLLVTNLDDSGDLTDKLSEAQEEVYKVEDQILCAQKKLNENNAQHVLDHQYALERRAWSDKIAAQSALETARANNMQFLANEWQRWADALQNTASSSDNSDKDDNDDAKEKQRGYETAHKNALEKRELAARQQDVADASWAYTNLVPTPPNVAEATYQSQLAQQYDADADNAEAQEANAKAISDAAWAQAKLSNDPAAQADADAVQDGADQASVDAAIAKAEAKSYQDLAKAVEKDAREAEQQDAKREGTIESWTANLAELAADLDAAHQGVQDVVNEIFEATKVWKDTAQRNLIGHAPAPIGIVVPANTTLLPGSGWTIQDLVPGGQFRMTVERLCRSGTANLMVNEVRVEEDEGGERVQLTAATVGVAELPPEPGP